MTRFWNNIHQVRSNQKANNLKVVWEQKQKHKQKGINMIVKTDCLILNDIYII